MSSSSPTAAGSAASAAPYNVSLPPITLPPASPPPPPPPPPVAPSNGFYGSAPPSTQYPLVPQAPIEDGRDLTGNKHKKEIKRRTKTGCLTCRSRRIKCDEGKPTCRNCEKSRRDCKGYDPLFVPQKPVSLQPAPAPAAAAPAPAPAPPLPSVPPLRAPPQYLPPPTSNTPPSHTLPPVPYTYIPPVPGANGYPSPASRQAPPALEPPVKFEKHDSPQGTISAMISTGASQETQRPSFKPVNIDDLFGIDAPLPTFVPPPNGGTRLTEAMLNEISILYYKDYAQGMDALFETNWYITRSRDLLHADKDLLELFAFLISLMADTKTEDFKGQNAIKSLEAKVTWRLMCLCRQPAADVPPLPNAQPGAPLTQAGEQILELRIRLDVFEHALTNRFTNGNITATIPYNSRDRMPSLKKYEVDFWHLVGEFVSIHQDRPLGPIDADRCLATARTSLGQLENRDIIYSILIARHFGGRTAQFPHSFNSVFNNDESDERTKLFVAKKFLEDESQRATHQVMQRVCNLAIACWHVARR